jgi:hypothetical protein
MYRGQPKVQYSNNGLDISTITSDFYQLSITLPGTSNIVLSFLLRGRLGLQFFTFILYMF